MAKKEKVTCPECGSTRIIKKGRRKNKFGQIQRYKCKSCERGFSFRGLKGRVYPAKLIMEAVSLFNRGYSMSEAVKQARKRFKAKVSKSAVDSWIKEFKDICTYYRIRGKALKLFPPEEVIFKKTFFHQIPYKFQYHRAKLQMFIKDYFSGLTRYLKNIPKKCPDRMFLSGKTRGSRIKLDFPIKPKRKTNYACRLAGLALTMTKNNRERHEVVQDFMLANDTATLACEVPVYLYSREVGRFQFFKDSGLDFREGVTGHIDLIQIRFGYLHLLDFKPEAAKEKYAMAQLFLYALALSARTGIWLRNFVCGWFDEKDYFEFRPADVVLKMEKVEKAEMRKYTPQF